MLLSIARVMDLAKVASKSSLIARLSAPGRILVHVSWSEAVGCDAGGVRAILVGSK